MPARLCALPRTGRRRAIASRGMTNAAFSRMKPVLLLAFLALGPALAQQFPVLPRTVSEAVAQRAGTPLAAPADAESIWLCRR